MSPTSKPATLGRKLAQSASSHPPERTDNLDDSPAPVARLATRGAHLAEAGVPVLPPAGTTSNASAETGRSHLGLIEHAENLVHYVVAAVLMAVAIFTLFDTTRTLTMSVTKSSFPAAATAAVNGVLFAVIIVEITRTVLSHFDKKGLQLQPFLIIGIVSALREVLSVGARLSLNTMPAREVHTSLLELGINAAVVVGLAGSLVLIRRYGSMPFDDLRQPNDGMVDAIC
jgi:uncharacterized membrane protein (DUF373 family)